MTTVSSDILINTTTVGVQDQQDMTVLADGRIVVVWRNVSQSVAHPADDIFAQIFNADGTASGLQFKVNTDRDPGLESATYYQYSPAVTATADGGFAVTYRDNRPTTSTPFAIKNELVVQRFDMNGSKVGADTTIISPSDQSGFAINPRDPDILGLAGGNYVVAVETDNFPNANDAGADDLGIVIQLFNSNGVQIGADANLNSTSAGRKNGVKMATDGSTFMAAWNSGHLPAGQNFGIMVQKFDAATGVRVGAEIFVSPGLHGTQFAEPEIAALTGGRYVVAWTGYSGASNQPTQVLAQIVAADGSLEGSLIAVSAAGGNLEQGAAVAARSDGTFLIVWQEGTGTSGTPIRGQLFNADGSLRGATFTIGSAPNADAVRPEVVALADGRFFVTWEDDSRSLAPAQNDEIHGAFVDPDETDGTPQPDILQGSSAAETLNGLGGNDRLIGAGGADVLNGGEGFDIASYEFSAQAVVVNLATNVATGGEAAGDRFISIEGVVGSAGSDGLTGNGVANTFQGLGGNDTIVGGAGVDRADYGGPRTSYSIAVAPGGGQIIIQDNRGGAPDGRDTVSGVERLQFGNVTLATLPATDFDGDFSGDMLLRSRSSGLVSAWSFDGGAFEQSRDLGGVGANISIVGDGDFNGDGFSDLLLRDATTGAISTWQIKAGAFNASVQIGGVGANIQIAGTGDFDGDNISDILLRDLTTGGISAWLLNPDSSFRASVSLGGAGGNIRIAGAGQFDGDGSADILLYDTTTGALSYWGVNNGAFVGSTTLGGFNSSVEIADVADFTGDGFADVLLRNRSTGDITYWKVDPAIGFAGSQQVGGVPGSFEVIGARDVDANGFNDVLLRDTSTGGIGAFATDNGLYSQFYSLGGAGSDFLLS